MIEGSIGALDRGVCQHLPQMRAAAPTVVAALALGASPALAQAHTGEYQACAATGDASIVGVSGASCEDAVAIAGALVAAPADDAAAVLAAAGWLPVRAEQTEDRSAYDIVATRGLAALRIRRTSGGDVPDLDGWGAGRELLFARGKLVGGARPPSDSVVCTSAFLVRQSNGALGGLSAAHCGGTRADGTTQRRNAALRRPPLPGIVLGRVQRNLERKRPLDALVLPVPSGAGRPATAIVDRGAAKPPWIVAGFGNPTTGRKVCMTGRTSGVDRCGIIGGAGARSDERYVRRAGGIIVRCTTIRARQGDSGGPVYTLARGNGTTRAVGIAVVIVGITARMCFTPLGPVLDALDAKLVIGGG